MDNFSGEISHVRPVSKSVIVGSLSNATWRAVVLKRAFRTLQNCLSKPWRDWIDFYFPLDF